MLVLSGYGLRLAVQRSHLVIEDGIADRRRVRRLSRIDKDLKRIAIIGHAGTISLDAIRWLHDVKIPLVHLDTDGRVLAMIAPDSPDHPTLRRAQARAVDSEIGLGIMRDLLRQKLDGQERVLRMFTAGQLALPRMELGRRGLVRATDFISLRSAEAQAAAAYWGAWGRVRVNFRVSDQDRVPEHWLTFGQRVSTLTGSPRLAVNPANAMLNYLYAILEAEARLALLTVGCDPGVGIQHADAKSRDSMACDVMEAVRPAVDAWLLDYLDSRTLRRQDNLELRNGQCRLMPDLAKELAQTAGLWSLKLGPVVEGVAETLHRHATAPERPRPWATSAKPRREAPTSLPTPLTESRRKVQNKTTLQPSVEESETTDAREVPIAMFSGRVTREWFLHEIVPALRLVPVEVIAKAVGLSEPYCAKIRTGRGLPSRRHWAAFTSVVQGYRHCAPLQHP
ncbi:MAG: CRISPR-associated endonuclease Cas1 [Gemmatimonadetes bacterium]|nr:CRISPR-associated endonuclease Cas1 [Gemmatimonadota bacterium]